MATQGALYEPIRGRVGRHDVRRLRDDDADGARSSRSCATASSTTTSRPRATRSCAPRRAPPPRSSSTGRRSTPRAAARSATAACSASADGALAVRGRGHAARGGHAGGRADRPSRHAARSARRRRGGDGRRSMRSARAHTMRNHTGTHLLHRALRNVVGERARQAGSLVTPDCLRFDFPFDRAPDGRREAGDRGRGPARSSARIGRSRSSTCRWPNAIERGADAFFDEKYGETVRTVRVEDYSFELCGGTHCRASGQIGSFVITGERSIGSGMRRIEALTGAGADAYLRARVDAARARRRDGRRDLDRRRSGSDRRPPGRAARGEAEAPRGRRSGAGLPRPGDLRDAARDRSMASRSSRSRPRSSQRTR